MPFLKGCAPAAPAAGPGARGNPNYNKILRGPSTLPLASRWGAVDVPFQEDQPAGRTGGPRANPRPLEEGVRHGCTALGKIGGLTTGIKGQGASSPSMGLPERRRRVETVTIQS